MLLVKPDEIFPVSIQLAADDSAQYPRAYVLDPDDGSVIKTIDLDYVTSVPGRYQGATFLADVGTYPIQIRVYSDSGHSVLNPGYTLADDLVRVSLLETIVNAPVAEFED